MKIIYAEEFQKQFQRIPAEVQKLYRCQELLFQANWRDRRLHVKKLKENPFPFSFRITRRYRVLFTFIDEGAVLFATIGSRRDIYRKYR